MDNLDEAAQLLETVLVDKLQVLTPGGTTYNEETYTSSRSYHAVGTPVKGLVQTTTYNNPQNGVVQTGYSIKVPVGTPLNEGVAVRVVESSRSDLQGKTLLVDSVNHNGLSTIVKGIATTFISVDPQGRGN